MIGIYTAMSTLQGGSGLPVFSKHLYSYFTTGKYVNLEIKNEDVFLYTTHVHTAKTEV